MKLYRYPILAMAMHRDDALDVLQSNVKTTRDHLIKLAVYNNSTGDRDHWIDEIATKLSIINDIVLKQGNKKRKPRDYEAYFFDRLCDTERDARIFIETFRTGEGQHYPDFKYSRDIGQIFLSLVSLIKEIGKEYIEKRNDFDKDSIYTIIHDSIIVLLD